jgi:hypothetical protein
VLTVSQSIVRDGYASALSSDEDVSAADASAAEPSDPPVPSVLVVLPSSVLDELESSDSK